jgi:radical SAM superfamily enzyme YgiQ (UPF0313 family)
MNSAQSDGRARSRQSVDAILAFSPYTPQLLFGRCYPAPLFLAQHVTAAGYKAEVVDFNREALGLLLRESIVREHTRRCRERVEECAHEVRRSGAKLPPYVEAVHDLSLLRFVRRNLAALRTPRNLAALRFGELSYSYLLHPVARNVLLSHLFLSTAPTPKTLDQYLASAEAMAFEKLFRERILTRIVRRRPRLVGFSVPFGHMLAPSLVLARIIKRSDADIHICLGGAYMGLLDEEFLAHVFGMNAVDSVVRFEGEGPLSALLDALTRRESYGAIPHLVTPGQRGACPQVLTIRGSARAPVRYARLSGRLLGDKHDQADVPIMHSVGCYWSKCSFCDYPNLADGARYRFRPATDVVDDMEYYAARGRRRFYLISSAIAPVHGREIAEKILQRKLDVSWSTFMRVDRNFDLQTLRAMKQSGFVCTQIGMETASDRLLKFINKGYDVATLRRFLDNVRSVGLPVGVLSVIVDIPSTTYQEALEIWEFCREYADVAENIVSTSFQLTQTSPMGAHPERWGIITEGELLEHGGVGERAGALRFSHPTTMSASEFDDILARYAALSRERHPENVVQDDVLQAIQQARGPADIANLRFSFLKRQAYMTARAQFDASGRFVRRPTNHFLFQLREQFLDPRHWVLITDGVKLLLNHFAGRVRTFSQLRRSVGKKVVGNDLDEVTVEFLKACATYHLLEPEASGPACHRSSTTTTARGNAY